MVSDPDGNDKSIYAAQCLVGGGPAGRVQSSRLRVISGEKHENDR